MERRLRGRERWFSTTLRSIADAVVMADLAGKITFMNAAAEALLGVNLKEALGRPAHEVMQVGDGEWKLDTPLERALRDRAPVHVAEVSLGSDDGSRKVIADSAAPVMDDNEMLGAVMVFRDVTEQKRLQKQLEVADRLASLGTMAAGVAHEINNPLAVVAGNAEFVLEDLVGILASLAPGPDAREPEVRTAIDAQRDIFSAASRIARIVSDLKAFSRSEPGGFGHGGRPGRARMGDPLHGARVPSSREADYEVGEGSASRRGRDEARPGPRQSVGQRGTSYCPWKRHGQ
jgi:PAS domain S-box-containing protein